MTTHKRLIPAITILILLLTTIFVSAQPPTLLNYQGRVTVDGINFDGTGHFRFALIDDNGTQTFWSNDGNSPPTTAVPLTVDKGLYSVLLGDTALDGMTAAVGPSIFANPDVYLRVWFSHDGSSFEQLVPDQRVVPVGYAMMAGGVHSDGDIIGGRLLIGNNHTMTGLRATIGGGENNQADNEYSTVSGGLFNFAHADRSTIGGGRSNLVTGSDGTIGGGRENWVAGGSGTVGGGWSNVVAANRATIAGGRFNTASGTGSTVGGGQENEASGEVANVAGGSFNRASGFASVVAGGQTNVAAANYTFIGGGARNYAPGQVGTIAGGADNIVSGTFSAVGGGQRNVASGGNAAIAGGADNLASGWDSAIGGGEVNEASGVYSAIAGGLFNVASGWGAFAAGRRAQATHQGSFVWGDSHDGDVASSATNQVTFRASGGFRIFSNTGLSQGVALAADGASWSSISDRDAKENFEAINSVEVLEQLAALPVKAWTYQTDPSQRRYIGPVAQDFHAAFGLGDDVTISTLDADGVLFAAVQGLNRKVEDRVSALEQENERLRAENQRMANELQAIRQHLGM